MGAGHPEGKVVTAGLGGGWAGEPLCGAGVVLAGEETRAGQGRGAAAQRRAGWCFGHLQKAEASQKAWGLPGPRQGWTRWPWRCPLSLQLLLAALLCPPTSLSWVVAAS